MKFRHLFFPVIFVLFAETAFSSGADTLFVGKGKSHTTIKSAIAAADSGDVVKVMAGIYHENELFLNKPVTLVGEPGAVIDAGLKNDAIIIRADSVSVTGFTIRNVATNYVRDLAAIHVEKVKHFRIQNNTLENTFFGIYLQKCGEGVVRNNTIKGQALNEAGSGNAIHLWYCRKVTVTDNEASGHRDGVYLEFSDSITIERNISYNNLRYGLHFMFSHNNNYLGNTFQSNGAGVAVMFSRNIIMKGNRFINNWGSAAYGILLKEIRDGEISHNVFQGNTVGIYGESSERLVIRNNDFFENGFAMRMMGSCAGNTITENNFIDNTFDIATNSTNHQNTYSRNYWSDYTGYDLDKDGIGDVPYRPVKLFSYLIEKVPQSIVLLRSMFVDILNFTERVTPVFTPQNLFDDQPLMKPHSHDLYTTSL